MLSSWSHRAEQNPPPRPSRSGHVRAASLAEKKNKEATTEQPEAMGRSGCRRTLWLPVVLRTMHSAAAKVDCTALLACAATVSFGSATGGGRPSEHARVLSAAWRRSARPRTNGASLALGSGAWSVCRRWTCPVPSRCHSVPLHLAVFPAPLAVSTRHAPEGWRGVGWAGISREDQSATSASGNGSAVQRCMHDATRMPAAGQLSAVLLGAAFAVGGTDDSFQDDTAAATLCGRL